MKWIKRLLLALLVVLLLAGGFAAHTWYGKPLFINHLYLRILMQAVLEDPLVLTQLRILESVGLDFHADDLPDTTFAVRERLAEIGKNNLETLERYDTSGMTPDEKLSWDAVHWLMVRWARDAERFMKHGYAIEQLEGLHVRFPDVMVNHHQIDAPRDAERYLARVTKIGGALDDLAKTAQDLAAQGYTIPRFILEKVEADVKAFYDQPLEDNPLYVDFEEKVTKLQLGDADAAELIAQMKAALQDQALPGYRRFGAAVAKMATETTTIAGVWHLPDGEALYQNAIELSTTTTLSADRIHAIGRREVARIQGEMLAIMAAQGFTEGAFKARFAAVGADPRFQWEDSPAGREAILAEYRAIIADINGKLGDMFQTDPNKPVSVERVPEFKEKTSPGAYYFPEALDGSKPGTFYANLRDVKAHRKFTMRTLAYHEAVPGHHFQLSVARAQDDLPLIRQLLPMTAYTEGWALYAEQLAAEHGFEDDPFDRLGYLDAQLFRAVRLVVDTGLHAKRWSRERAIEYMFANTGMERGEVEAEIERYCVWPGQALGYMVGRLELLRLRARAQVALGERFDLERFHDVLLLGGALPLELLSQQVDAWIAAEQRGGSR